MWLKFLLGSFFMLSLLSAFVLAPHHSPSQNNQTGDISNDRDRRRDLMRLRVLTWNIGNGDLEPETRAHDKDLPAVAQVIQDNDPDAVAIQELTGKAQLKLLLTDLGYRYRGYACN